VLPRSPHKDKEELIKSKREETVNWETLSLKGATELIKYNNKDKEVLIKQDKECKEQLPMPLLPLPLQPLQQLQSEATVMEDLEVLQEVPEEKDLLLPLGSSEERDTLPFEYSKTKNQQKNKRTVIPQSRTK
jgi:hypothetical protein